MKEQLIQYVNLLFAGVPDCEDMKQEILQNTLDRYDDLISQGKVPEAAYRLAISGIGDVNELLGNSTPTTVSSTTANSQNSQPDTQEDANRKKLRAGDIALYILSAIPLIVLSDLGYETFGLVLTLIMVAAATFNMIMTARKDEDENRAEDQEEFPERKKEQPQPSAKKEHPRHCGCHYAGGLPDLKLCNRCLVYHLADLPHFRMHQRSGQCHYRPKGGKQT